MYLFVDSEFLPRADGSNELLSIGLCGMDGREFYAEHDVQVDPAGHEFVSAEVLPQLGRGGGIRGALPDVGAALANWLCQYGAEQLEVCYDYHVDREALETLLLVANPSRPICFEPVHVAYLLADEEGRLAAERCWTEIDVSRGLHRHHALADSLALRARFCAVHRLEDIAAALTRADQPQVGIEDMNP